MKKIFCIILCLSFFAVQAQYKFTRSYQPSKKKLLDAIVKAQLKKSEPTQSLKIEVFTNDILEALENSLKADQKSSFSSKIKEVLNPNSKTTLSDLELSDYFKISGDSLYKEANDLSHKIDSLLRIIVRTPNTPPTRRDLRFNRFTTSEYILYTKEIDSLEVDLETLSHKRENLINSGSLHQIQNELPKIDNAIVENRQRIDTLLVKQQNEKYKIAEKVVVSNHGRWFPNHEETNYILNIAYGENGKSKRFFSTTSVGLGFNSSSVYSEIYNDRFQFFRVGLGVMVNKSAADSIQEAQTDEAYQRLLTSGGNTVINLDYPYTYHTGKKGVYHGIGFFNLRGAADLPDFGSSTDDFLAYFSPGVNYYGEFSTKRDVFKFFFDVTGRYFFGGKNFRDNLELSKKSFGLLKLDVGIQVNNFFAISLTPFSYSNEKNFRNNRVVLSLKMID